MPHLHLILNHIPVEGTLAVLLLLLWGLVRRSRDVMRAAFGGVLIVALGTSGAFYTGDEAAETLESAPWFQKTLVEHHDDRAGVTLTAALVMAAAAAFALWHSRTGRPIRPFVAWAVAAGLVVTFGLAGWTALAGGVIRHDEIRSPANEK